MPQYGLMLTESDIKVIIEALGELKHRIAAPVISSIYRQIIAQQERPKQQEATEQT